MGRMALFSTLCSHAALGRMIYKIRTSKRHTKPKYVKSNQSQNLVVIFVCKVFSEDIPKKRKIQTRRQRVRSFHNLSY